MTQNLEYVSLKNDLLFHMVFTRNPLALKGLLSALLDIPESRFERVDVLNPMQYSEANDSKLTILDLKVHLNDNSFVLVEIQVRKFNYWTNRTLIYAARAISDQFEANSNYKGLEPVIQISIMDYSLFPDHKKFFTKYVPRDEDGYVYTDKLRFYVLDLTQIGNAAAGQKDQGLVKWANAFKAKSWDEVNNLKDSGIKEAAKTMQLIMANPTEREWIRMRRDAEIDWRTQINAAESKGMAQGMAQGKTEVARGMKRDGVDPAFISKYSGLTLEEIDAL